MKNIAVLITIFATFLGGVASLLLKLGSANFRFNIIGILKNFKLILGFLLYGIASIIFIIALKYAELSLLYPIVSLSYVWACLLSMKFLNEKMNGIKWTGVLIIVIGVALIGMGS